MNISEAIRRIPYLLGELIDWPAELYANRIAVEWSQGALTYSQLRERISATECEYRRLGVYRFTRWGLAVENSPEFFIHFFALVRIGCVVAPLNPYLPTARFQEIINSDSLSGVTVPSAFKDISTIPCLLPGCRIQAIMGAIIISRPFEPVFACQLVDVDPALILRSSGSKGLPRGVVLQHHAVLANMWSNIRALGYRDDDRTLIVLPLHHGYGLVHQALCHLAIGATVVLPPVPLAAPILVNALKRHGITTLSTAPPLIEFLRDGLQRGGVSLPALRLITVGTGRANIESVRAVQRLLPQAKIAITYGLSESGPRVSTNFIETGDFDPGCVGSALPNMEILLDPTPSEPYGEVRVRGRSLLRNFASQSFHEGTDCSISTSDIGELRQGKLYLIRRLGRSINRGGVLVAAENIEEVLLAHPSVQSAKVDAQPDSFWGEVPVAFVTLREDGAPTTEEELLRFCALRLPKADRPARISITRQDDPLSGSKDSQMAALFKQ